jgi:Tol biopolymer transport system component/flagellar hook assembly protein FlgD/fibronectin type 3 domain-containing protein
MITVRTDTRPNLVVSYEDIVITPSPGNERGTVTISALVKNDGFSPANSIAVRFYRGVPCSNTELGVKTGNSCAQALQIGTQQVIATLGPGENSRVSVDWVDIPESGKKLIYVEAYTETAISEISDKDNYGFVNTFTLRCLPDLAVSTNSIVFSPVAPKEGDTVAITVSIQNKGEQAASNVVVRLSEGSVLPGNQQTIPSLEGGGTATVSFSYAAAVKGAHTFTAVVDPYNEKTEQSKDNNNASRTLGVQDSSLWVTEQYLSPNGDGIKDSTQLFFSLDTPRTVTVSVVNNKGETMRTFNGPELAATTVGAITWDGFNDNGTVVADGTYQMQLRDAAAVIGSLGITVDTNRSPLSDAIVETKYLLNNNLTCMLPNITSWGWFNDESGIAFSIDYSDYDTPEYPNGVYTMAPNGEDILRLIPDNWTDQNYPNLYYESFQNYSSPDGSKIAFTFWKYSQAEKKYTHELWIVDRDGQHLSFITSATWTRNYDTRIYSVKWSADNKHLSYIESASGNFTLWIFNAGTLQKNMVDSNVWYYADDESQWSPDGTLLAYQAGYCNQNDLCLMISDPAGNKKGVFSQWGNIYWLGNKVVSYSSYGNIWLVDTSGNGNHIKISDYIYNYNELSLSPDKKSLLLVDSSEDRVIVKIFDDMGNVSIVYNVPKVDLWCGEGCEANISNFIWSPDGKKLAFVDKAYKEIDKCIYEPDLIVVDAATKNTTASKIFDSEFGYKYYYHDGYDPGYDPNCADPRNYKINHIREVSAWLPDNVNLLLQSEMCGAECQTKYFDFNTETGKKGQYLEFDTAWSPEKITASPRGSYINYVKRVDESSACFHRGYEDLWAMSSLMNLTADLRTSKEKSAIILKGIAADLNFESFQLEYADIKYPDAWSLVQPPSSVPVINDLFTTWVPPYEGSFYVRLTVWDKAGNTAVSRKQVSWGQYSSITNLYKSLEIFSPNGDIVNGVKNTVELHYRALEPVHLEFNIYDDANNVVNTYYKDHAGPTEDFMQWDGTDQSHNTVPNGKYKIKVFDYEFFVEVDSTPPDVGINFNGIMQDFDVNTKKGSLKIITDLQGHAVDKNLKSWLVEYGEGDNPQEWIEYSKGESQLVGKDNDGNPILNPTQDVSIKRFEEGEVAWLANKKFKITVEDYAGNKTTLLKNFIEEKLLIHKHQWKDKLGNDHFGLFALAIPESISPELIIPGPHSLGGLETIRTPIAGMKVQYYSSDHKWVDSSTAVNSLSGYIDLGWDPSGIKQEFSKVRVKAIDTLGQEYYSNVILTGEAFFIDECATCPTGAEKGMNVLFEELKLLTFQIDGTDYRIFDSTKGDIIPTGLICVPPHELKTKFTLTMVGVGISGKKYESRTLTYPSNNCGNIALSLELKVNPAESDCGVVSNRAELKARLKESDIFVSLKTISYYIQKSDGLQLLQQFDASKGDMGSLTIDTSTMAEGNYSVKAALSYLDLKDNTTKEISASNTLTVDRVLPIAQITYPTKSTTLCPVKNADAKGNWYGLPIEGIATDNNTVQHYELYYGDGENPAVWLPALTRVNGKSVAIKETKTVQGELGVWDVTDLHGTTYSLKLKVVDVAGNVSCYTTSFSMDTLTEIANLTIDKNLFSPNGNGNVKVSYQIDEYATLAVRVFKLIQKADKSYGLDAAPVRTITAAKEHLGGSDSTVWDGKTDGGTTAPDGKYGIVVYATDSCGNTAQKWIAVEVDTTPPTLAITYPGAESTLGSLIVEVKGTADDPHFQSYSLERGQEEVNPTEWIPVSSGTLMVNDSILGKWNTSGLTGRWTLRLTATDAVGNNSEVKVPATLVAPAALIKNYDVTPGLISPNNNGTLEATDINYEIGDAADIKIEVADSSKTVKHTHIATKSSAGTYTYNYGGQNDPVGVLPDGVYTVSLIATSSTSSQREAITITVDTTKPTVDMTSPKDNSFLAVTDLAVIGTVSDSSMAEYSLSYAGAAGSTLIDQGSQSRTGYTFGSLNAISEGDYTLTVRAKDLGENETNKTTAFTIDRTPPAVKLDTSKEGAYYGGTSSALSSQPSASITVTGSIVEKNLDIFNLRYGLGDNPSQWIDLVTGSTITAYPSSYTWKVDGVPDGLYTLSLFAKDKAGLTGEQKAKVTIDNTAPTCAITSLHDGDYVKQAVVIKGTAFDQNLDKYTLEISEGQCASAFKWAQIKSAAASVQDGVLGVWQALPPDGDYCLRVTAIDKVGSSSEAKVNVKVDTHPPAAPVLSGKVDTKTNAQLDWTNNTEPDLAGRNIYKAGQKISTALITDITYLDQNLTEGVYTYTVKAVDLAGNESSASNEIKLKIDLTGPDARIRSPHDGGTVSDLIDIKGTAYSNDDFKQYRVSIGQGASPSSWTIIRTSPLPTSYGVFAQWDTLGLADNQVYSVKLEAEDVSGNITTDQISVTIDNTPPAAPDLTSATTVTNSADVALTWQPNIETDLAGYLLYRNDQLANVSSIVAGDLKPYLISALTTTYLDKSLPDGTFTYYLMAMDQAGNISDQSNPPRSVTIDTHPPHAAIVDPADKTMFGGKIMVKAESPDLDIASIQFQYQNILSSPTTTTDWTNLGSLVTTASYITYMDPSSLGLGLAYGDYRLRAVATDKGLNGNQPKIDPIPGFITISYTDLTPLAAPSGLNTLVSGGTVTLTWTAKTESDLDGYNVYRTSGSIRTQINAALIKAALQPTYQDSGLGDGTYSYDVTAVDTYKNESLPSGTASARVYAPVLSQPYTPVGQSTIQVQGTNAVANAAVSISADTVSGLVSLGTATADAAGVFMANAALTLGENRITARATDIAGNISKDSVVVIVIYNDTPGAPTGLAAPVQDHDVHLAWNQNPETDILGYNLYRDGVKVIGPDNVAPIDAIASSSFDHYPWASVDNDQNTYWMPQDGTNAAYPAWWEMNLAAPELINHLEIHWGTDLDSSGNEVTYAGKDFEIQVWSADANAWITQANVTGNAVKNNVFDFKPAYRTDKVRILVTDSTDSNSAKQVRLAEVNLLKDNVVQTTPPSYDDLNLLNKQYGYSITAVDNYGFESPASEMVGAVVGDIVPPSAPVLTASVLNSDVTLNWTTSPETDTTSYTIYRNIGQGWAKIGTTSVPLTTYLNAYLLNGVYSYRVAAVDAVGNEGPMSNVETETVYVAPSDKHASLTVSTTPEGGLNATWTYDGSPAGFNIYRSLTAGGPYREVNSALVNGYSYFDTGVTNGVTYYYVVAAADLAGNVGLFSNEASGTPLDIVAPAKPVILLPTVTGAPITLFTGRANVSGTVDPDAFVDLFQNGAFVGRTATQLGELIQKWPLDHDGNVAALSPDGNTLAYTLNDYIWFKSLVTGAVTQVFQAKVCYTLVWSPEGKKIAYTYYDSNWNVHIGIYDVSSGSTTLLPPSIDGYEDSPTWSPDGTRLAFIEYSGQSSDVRIMDLTSGTITQVISSASVYNAKLSPDGKLIAYRDSQGLSLFDLVSNATRLVDSNADSYSFEWSYDGSRLAFISYRSGIGAVYVLNIADGTEALVPGSSSDPYYLSWAADGQSVVFAIWDSTCNRDTLWMADVQTQTAARQIMPDLKSIWSVWSARGGAILFINQDAQGNFTAYTMKNRIGSFTFDNVALVQGKNIFTAVTSDTAGNSSAASDAISVVFDTSTSPELSLSSDDVYLYPPYPIAGDQMSVNAVVTNASQTDIQNVDVAVYIWNALGQLELLKSETIPFLEAGSSGLVTATWDSTGKTGDNRLVVVVDPDSKILELDETNNLAIKDFYVADHVGVSMSTALDAVQYSNSQNANISLKVRNTGTAASGLLNVRIEDANGYSVITFDPKAVSLAYASTLNQTFSWNTGSTYAGTYIVHSVLKDTSGIVLAENTTPFTIVSDAVAELTVVTDKISYGPQENVVTSFTIKNTGKNYIIPTLQATVSITGALETVLFSEIKTASSLLPGASVDLSSLWNTGLTMPGDYHVVVQVSFDGGATVTKSAAFKINTLIVLSGAIMASPSVVPLGNTAQVTYTLANTGNADALGYTARISILDPETQTVMQAHEELVDIAKNSSKSGQVFVSTNGYGLKTYTAVLQAISPTGTKTIANASFIIKDLTPPVVTILSPVEGNSYDSTVLILTSVTDNASGVDQVEYRRDSGTWSLLPVSDPACGRFGATWDPTMADNGTHSVSFRATDKARNISEPVTVSYEVRINRAPTTPSPAAPADGADVGTPLPDLIVNNASDPNNDLLTYAFEVYADSDLTVKITSAGGVAEGTGTTSWQVSQELTENAMYYWRARVFDGKLYGEWMSTAAFRVNAIEDPPSAPVPTSPGDGTEVPTLTPVLTVINAVDPDSTSLTYNFQVALDPEFISIVTSTLGVFAGQGTTSWQVPVPLEENRQYYWRAQADDWTVPGPWFVPVSFTVNTGNNAPSVPVVIAPADGTEVTTLSPDIVLQNSMDLDSEVIKYSIELDTVRTFDSSNLRRVTGLPQGERTTVWHVDGLSDNMLYFVRAKASDGAAESDWSGVPGFFVNTANDAPEKPVPANPSDGAGVNVFTPTLSVQNATDIDRDILTYDFKVYEDAALSKLVASVTGVAEMAGTTSWTVSVALKENQTYYWQAQAYDGELVSGWTTSLSFTVNTGDDEPTAPSIVFPAEGGSVDIAMPTLTVLNATDPDSSLLTYEFQVFYESALIWTAGGIPEGTAGSTSAMLSVALTDNTAYSWRCRANDGNRDGAWTAMTKFTVHLPQTGITVDIEVEPESLSQKSKGNWVMVEIEFPHGYRASDVDIASIRLEGIVPAMAWPREINKHHHDHGCEHEHAEHDHSELKVKFRRSDAIAVLPAGNHVPVHITGMVAGTPFEGVDIIRVIH